MEYLDILDKKGNKTGEKKTRGEAHDKGLWHKAVDVCIINDKNQILIQKRNANRKTNSNKWTISMAGHVMASDDCITTCVREMKEELCIEFKKSDFKLLFNIKQKNRAK